MIKLTIPVLLAATIAVAGMFAFMPVEQASTVHTTLNGGGFDSITLGSDLDLSVGADRFVLVDIHQQVATDGGFVVIRASTPLTCTDLAVVVMGTDGVADGTTVMGLVAAVDGGEDNAVVCHAHVPSVADGTTAFVALAWAAGTPTIKAHAIITTTIQTLV